MANFVAVVEEFTELVEELLFIRVRMELQDIGEEVGRERFSCLPTTASVRCLNHKYWMTCTSVNDYRLLVQYYDYD